MIDPEMKQELGAINTKLDTYIKHQREILDLKLEPINEHLKDGPHFRDKIVKIGESLRINWVLTLMMIGGCVGGFWWLLRN